MDQTLANALKRRDELLKELQRLQQFIEMYYELSGTNQEEPDMPKRAGNAFVISAETGIIRARGRPADFARIMETILKDAGKPLHRGQLVEEVEKRGHSIPSDDKPRYLGTILWRNGDMFESVEGRGYWLKGVPLPDEPELLGGDGWTQGSAVDLK